MCFDNSYLKYKEAEANPESKTFFWGEGKQKLIFDKFYMKMIYLINYFFII